MSSSTFTIADLGPAAPSETLLRSAVADQLGLEVPDLGEVEVEVAPVAHDAPALTTLARWWVRGHAATPTGRRPFGFFVKVVQAWTRSPAFAHVPPEHRAAAAAGLPWRTEPLAYRSDLGTRLPAGLRMPRAHAVVDLDDESCALWLEEVPAAPAEWTPARVARAAHLLGRLATSAQVAPLAGVGGFDFRPSDYVRGRLSMQVVPILRSPIWEHPLLAGAFDGALHRRVDAVLARLDDLAAEADDLPVGAAHGDAAPGNLLADPDDPDGFVVVDLGFFTPLPIGFDLGQLLVGDVVLGRRPAADLPLLEATALPAFLAGTRAESSVVAERDVRRAHALEMTLFRGLSALPFDRLDDPPEVLAAVARERAALTTFALDLLDETS